MTAINLFPIEVLRTEEAQKVLERIRAPAFKAADMPISYRIINHWHEKDLLPYRNKPGQWRMFSLADYVWVLFINKLRLLNVGLESIAKIKAQCFKSPMYLLELIVQRHLVEGESGLLPPDVQKSFEVMQDPELITELATLPMGQFLLWLLVALKNNQDVLVRIQPDEANTTDFVLLSEKATDTQQIVATIAKNGGLFISIQALLNEFYGSPLFEWDNIQKLAIDKEARIILGIIREKGIKEVTLQIHEGKVTRASTKYNQKEMTFQELNNAMLSQHFIEWRVVKQEGDRLFVSATKHHKMS